MKSVILKVLTGVSLAAVCVIPGVASAAKPEAKPEMARVLAAKPEAKPEMARVLAAKPEAKPEVGRSTATV